MKQKVVCPRCGDDEAFEEHILTDGTKVLYCMRCESVVSPAA